MHSGERWRLGHRPGLDGLRGVAILFVICVHLNSGWFGAWGSVGVGLFFVLSGFLITSLLLEEHDRTERIDLRAFYVRRARRLFPALAVLLITVGMLYYVLGWPMRNLIAVAFYFSNVAEAAGRSLPLLDHTWSLAVEEQFYFVWPLVMILALAAAGRRGLLLGAASIGSAAALAFRFSEWDGSPAISTAIRVSFHTNAAGLLVGCALAAWMVGRRVPTDTHPVAATLALACAGLVGLFGPRLGWGILAAPAAYVAGALAIWWLVRGPSAGWLGSRAMRFIGRRSYGYYLWHVPAIALAAHFTSNRAWWFMALLIALGVAELSWRFVERPFLRRKPRQARGWIVETSHQPLAAQSLD
jgi:peptidoglycan/LPS O-acetylase OafA/YrhL